MKYLTIILMLLGAPVYAQSTINPNVPVQGSSLTSAPVRQNFTAAYNDVNTLYGLINGLTSEQTISFQPGALTSVTNTKGGFVKFVNAATVDNIEASAISFICSGNPTITLYDCSVSTTCAAPTTLGSVTLTTTGTVVDGTISSSAIGLGHYVAWNLSAGTCSALNFAATAQVHSTN